MDQMKVNPFVSRMNISPVDLIKLVLGLMVLMPVRLVLSVSLAILCSLVGYLLVLVTMIIGHHHLTHDQSTFKRIAIHLTNGIYALAMIIAGLRVEIEDRREDVDKGHTTAIMVVAPHSSHFDYRSMMALGPITPVSKAEALWNPFVGSQLFLSNAILVKRNDERSRRQVIKDLIDRSKHVQVGIFPEATTTDGSSLIKFKPGGFIPGLPVLPTIIRYSYQGTVNNVSWTWKGHNVAVLWVLSCASCSWTWSKVTYLPVYHPDEEEKKSPQLYANNVRTYMAANLNIPLTRYSFEDAFFLEFARKAMVSYSPISLKFINLAYKLARFQTVSRDDSMQNKTEIKVEFKQSQQQIFKRLVDNTSEKLIQLFDFDQTNMSTVIANKDDLAHALGLPVEVDATQITAILVDLLDSMKLNPYSVVTFNHLLLFLTLMDSSSGIWTRIAKFVALGKQMTAMHDQDALKYLIWFLIGVEEDQLDCNILDEHEFNYTFLKLNLQVTFRAAVEENCGHLFVD